MVPRAQNEPVTLVDRPMEARSSVVIAGSSDVARNYLHRPNHHIRTNSLSHLVTTASLALSLAPRCHRRAEAGECDTIAGATG